MELKLRRIEPRELRNLYRRMKRDFPPSERAPYFAIRRGMLSGFFEGFFLSRAADTPGYAVCTPLHDRGFALVNYLAVEPDARNSGLGSRLMLLLEANYPALSMMLEVENPDYAGDDGKEALMRRRILFYERAGYHIIEDVRYRLFGVEMLLMTNYGAAVEDTAALMRAFYLPSLRNERLMRFVEVTAAKD